MNLTRKVSDAQSRLMDEKVSLQLEQQYLLNERERQLRARLDSEGLAICFVEGSSSWVDPHKRLKSGNSSSRVGVFPKDQMTIIHTANTAIQRTSDFARREPRREVETAFYCHLHIPVGSVFSNYSFPNSHDPRLGPDMFTQVTFKDGKYFADVDGSVVGTPTQGMVREEVYQHFGFPTVPSIPNKVL